MDLSSVVWRSRVDTIRTEILGEMLEELMQYSGGKPLELDNFNMEFLRKFQGCSKK